jgi:NADPH2:quinone reductase
VRTAIITELSSPPQVVDRDEPTSSGDELLLDVRCAALNPIDLAIAAGRFYAGHPPLPYVPTIEAVGTVGDRLVYAQGSGRGIAVDGFARERVAVVEADLIDLPAGTDPQVAVALGTAGLAGWLATTWRVDVRADDLVVVLGASGAVGSVAVQAAKSRGARVVAVGRDAERLERFSSRADARVTLGDDLSTLAARVAEAAIGAPTVVVDMLWGAPLAALLSTVAPHGRVVHVGASAGAVSELPSAPLRGKLLDVLGYSNFGVPRDVLRAGLLDLVAAAEKGTVTMPLTPVSLEGIADGWNMAVAGGHKVVVTVGGAG